MAFPTIAEQKHTRADLTALYDLPGNAGKTFELLNGEIYDVPKPKPNHVWTAHQISRLLGSFVVEHGLGNVFNDNNQYDLPNGDTLVPDVSFVANETFVGIPTDYHTVAPDLAVEVDSPSNDPVPTLEKVESYLANGTKRVWAVRPEARVVNVFRQLDDSSIQYKSYRIGDTLVGEDILPGLTIAVADIFPKPQPAESQTSNVENR